jgi:hypothetical protein
VAGRADAGALVTFSGLVRDAGGGLEAMEIEHYPGMTETAIAAIEAEAVRRWGLTASLVIHRHGRLAPGEPIMMVADRRAAPGGRLRGGRVPDGLPQVPRALLEEGDRAGRHIVGGGEGRGRGGARPLVTPLPASPRTRGEEAPCPGWVRDGDRDE